MTSIARTYTFADNKDFTGSKAESELSLIADMWNRHDSGLLAWTKLNVSGTTKFNGATYTWPSALPGATSILQTTAAGALSWVASASAYAPIGASYVTLGTDTNLTSERVLTAGTAINLTDAGAGSTITINNTGVTSAVAGTGIGVSGATGAVTFSNTGVTSATGTSNQVNVSAATGAVTFSLPQNIHSAATPTFASVSLTAISNQLVLGTTRTATITAPTPGTSSRTYTFPDQGADYSVVASEGTQTINGAKTFGSAVTLAAGTVSAPGANWSDSGTGIYRLGSNQLAIAINGVQSAAFVSNGSTNATTYAPFLARGGAGSSNQMAFRVRQTTGVSTSAATISDVNVDAALIFVTGNDGSSNEFFDLITASFYSAGGVARFVSQTVRGTPSSRTYSMASNDAVQLAMGSGTYTIRAWAMCVGVA